MITPARVVITTAFISYLVGSARRLHHGGGNAAAMLPLTIYRPYFEVWQASSP